MPEFKRRAAEKRKEQDPTKQKPYSVKRGLDRRAHSLDSVEGQLQKAQRIFEMRDTVIAQYIKRKIAKMVTQYKEIGRTLTPEEKKYFKDTVTRAATRLHNLTLAKARDFALRDKKTGLLIEEGFRSYVEAYMEEQPHGTFFFIDINNLYNNASNVKGNIFFIL